MKVSEADNSNGLAMQLGVETIWGRWPKLLEPFVERLGKVSGGYIMENYRKWLRRSLVMEVAYVEVERANSWHNKKPQELGGEDADMQEIPQQRYTVKGDRFRPAKHQKKTEVRSVSRPDEAEGQRQNLTYSDLSKLSLGRVKQRICTD